MEQFYVLYVHTLLLLCAAKVENLAVVEFQAQAHEFQNKNEDAKQSGHLKTHEVTFCFRFMTRMNPKFSFVNINQINIKLSDDEVFVFIKSWNTRDLTEGYSRMFKMCKAYAPGQWMSVCISVKLKENIQEITYFQDGQPCVETSFKDGDFDWIYFKPPITVGDL